MCSELAGVSAHQVARTNRKHLVTKPVGTYSLNLVLTLEGEPCVTLKDDLRNVQYMMGP